MKKLLSSIAVVACLSTFIALASIGVTADIGCSAGSKVVTAVGSGGKCLVSDLEQTVKSSGLTIIEQIESAVLGGVAAAVPTAIADIVTDFGPDIAQCAATVVNDLESVKLASAAKGSELVQPSVGYAALIAEMKKRGWPTK